MIKHIVIWRLKEHAHGNDRATNARLIKEKLESLRGQIPGLLAIEVGLDFSATAESGDVVLYSEFADLHALEAYHTHPAHLAVAPFVSESRASRQLVDYVT
jgi:Stress responsive A/B Barrel Domain